MEKLTNLCIGGFRDYVIRLFYGDEIRTAKCSMYNDEIRHIINKYNSDEEKILFGIDTSVELDSFMIVGVECDWN